MKPGPRVAHRLALAFVLVVPVAQAAIHDADPGNYRALLLTLEAGDQLHLAPGDYRAGLPVHRLHGTPDAPIVIAGPTGLAPARLLARPGHNTVSLRDVSHVVIRNLKIDGAGLPVDGVKCEGDSGEAHHVTLENLTIVGHGANQQIVGISTKCPAGGWIIRGNLIVSAGTGIYLGDADGGAPFFDGEIVDNVVLNAQGYDLQIKHQSARPSVPGATGAPRRTLISGNVFAKLEATAPTTLPRPNLLLGHWPREGAGAEDRYVVEDNLIYRNPAEALVQAEGRISLRHNWLFNPTGPGIHIRPHHDVPRDIEIECNVIVARDAGIRIRTARLDPPPRIEVGYNTVFASTPLSGVASTGSNLTGTYAEAARTLAQVPASLAALDLSFRAVIAEGAGFNATDRVVQSPAVRHACAPDAPRAARARRLAAASILSASGMHER